MSWQKFYEMEAEDERRSENAARRAAMTPEQIEAERLDMAQRTAKNDALVAEYKRRNPDTGLRRKAILEEIRRENFLKLAKQEATQ